jgi:hypothetical protein
VPEISASSKGPDLEFVSFGNLSGVNGSRHTQSNLVSSSSHWGRSAALDSSSRPIPESNRTTTVQDYSASCLGWSDMEKCAKLGDENQHTCTNASELICLLATR